MANIDFLEAAEAYADVTSSKHRLSYIRQQIKVMAKGESFPNSVLGAITVGVIKFIIDVIVNFVKYIALVIQTLISDSGIIPSVIKSLQGVFGEAYIPITNTIKITDIKLVQDKFNYTKGIVSRRLNHAKDNKGGWLSREAILDKFRIIADPILIKKDYFSKDFIENIESLDELNNAVNEMKKEYIRDTKENDIEAWKKIKQEISVKDHGDAIHYIKAYRDLLKDTLDELINPFIEYNKIVEKRSNEIVNNLKKFKLKPETATMEVQAVIKYAENLLPYMIQNFKNIQSMITWIRVEVVSNLLVLTKGGL